ARSLPETVLRRHEAVPVLRVSNEMTVLLADPTNHQAAIELEALSGSRITVALAAREAVLHFLDRAFPDSKRPMGQPLPGANGNRHANGNGHGHAPLPHRTSPASARCSRCCSARSVTARASSTSSRRRT